MVDRQKRVRLELDVMETQMPSWPPIFQKGPREGVVNLSCEGVSQGQPYKKRGGMAVACKNCPADQGLELEERHFLLRLSF
jgi:hypothetical protein